MSTRKFKLTYFDKNDNPIKSSNDFFIDKAEAIKFAQLQYAKDSDINHWAVSELLDNQPNNNKRNSGMREFVESFVLGTGTSSASIPYLFHEGEYPFITKLAKFLGLDPLEVGGQLAGNIDSDEVKRLSLKLLGELPQDFGASELSEIGSNFEEFNQFFDDLV